MRSPSTRSDLTRDALLSAATVEFARDGFAAASTRAIADAAKTNQALIGYHFGGKEGLYIAVFENIASHLNSRLGGFVDVIESQTEPLDPGNLTQQQHAALLQLLMQLTDGMIVVLTRDEATPWAQLIMREQQTPTEAFAVLYDGFMSRLLGVMTRLVMVLRANDETDARLLLVTIMGQVMAFRVARAGVMRHLGWDHIGDPERVAVQVQVRKNLAALFRYQD